MEVYWGRFESLGLGAFCRHTALMEVAGDLAGFCVNQSLTAPCLNSAKSQGPFPIPREARVAFMVNGKLRGCEYFSLTFPLFVCPLGG